MLRAAGLGLSESKTVVVNYSGQSEFAVRRMLCDIVGLGGAVVARVGTYLGLTLGPEVEERLWAQPLDKFRRRFAHFRMVSGFTGDRVRAYRTHAQSELWYKAQVAQPSRQVLVAEQAAIASILNAPLHAFTAELLESITLWGSRLATPTVATAAAVAQCREAATHPRLRVHLSRLDAPCVTATSAASGGDGRGGPRLGRLGFCATR